MKLSQIKKEFEKYIVIKDPWVIDIVLATLIGNALIDRDPIWTMLVAPSSGGKTTLIAPAVGVPTVYFIDDLTEKTLLSGYKVKGKEVSLLTTIGSGVMAFSDFTSILSKNPQSRGEILTQLKLVYDRKITKYTGTGKSAWEGKIGFLGAATPDIYTQLESGRSMGERFLYYWVEQPTDEEISKKQQNVRISSKDITDQMKDKYLAYCKSVKGFVDEHGLPELSVTKKQREEIQEAAIFCVNGKATVHLNFKTGKVDQIPNKAGVGRDAKMFDAILQTFQLMDAYEAGDPTLPVSDERIALVQKCAYSSINRERRKILEILTQKNVPMSASQIGAEPGLGLEKTAVEMYLMPLHAVGLIRKEVGGNSHKWEISMQSVKDFVERVSPNVTETFEAQGILPDAIEEEKPQYPEPDWDDHSK
jgi:hypothetical protein